MITWQLPELMNRLGITSVALAKELGVSTTTISNYRRAQPALTQEGWDDLLNAINRLRRADSDEIGFDDLSKYKFVKKKNDRS